VGRLSTPNPDGNNHHSSTQQFHRYPNPDSSNINHHSNTTSNLTTIPVADLPSILTAATTITTAMRNPI
jgi:hypothetical protein